MSASFSWARLTIWSCTTELVFQLVRFIHCINQSHWAFDQNVSIIYSSFFSVKSDRNSLLIELCRTILMVFWTFVCLFVVCEIGEMLMAKFEMFNAELCQCNWYLYSIKMQRMLMIFISNTQQPTIIQTIGNRLCARITFTSVKFLFFYMKFNSEFFV